MTLDPAVNNNENIDIVWSCSEDIACDEQGPISTSDMGEFKTLKISPVAVQDNGTMFTCTGTVTGVSNVQPAINSTIYNIIVTGKLYYLTQVFLSFISFCLSPKIYLNQK